MVLFTEIPHHNGLNWIILNHGKGLHIKFNFFLVIWILDYSKVSFRNVRNAKQLRNFKFDTIGVRKVGIPCFDSIKKGSLIIDRGQTRNPHLAGSNWVTDQISWLMWVVQYLNDQKKYKKLTIILYLDSECSKHL